MAWSKAPVIVANRRSMNLRVNDPNLIWVHSPVLLRQGNQQPPLTVRWILVTEVTEHEVTGRAISEKIASLLNNILASSLNEQATKRRKQNIHRHSNSKLLTQTRVNLEIWDIAKNQTRSMDSRLQALQDTLIKGLIPLANLTGKVGDSLDSDTVMTTKEALWEGLSDSLLLVAAANHSLNICRRDMFKTDLDDN